MGMFLSFEREHRVLLIRFEGVLTDELLYEGYQEVREWMEVNGHASQLTDFSTVTSFSVTPYGVRRLAEKAPLAPDNFRRMVVAPHPLMYGMTRMFEMIGSDSRGGLQIFASVAEAYASLGFGADNFRPVME